MASGRCELTGVSCEGREILKIAGNAPVWISPVVKVLLIQGKTIMEIKDMVFDLENMDLVTRLKVFAGSKTEIK